MDCFLWVERWVKVPCWSNYPGRKDNINTHRKGAKTQREREEPHFLCGLCAFAAEVMALE
jgi:hypothetical protein